MAEPATPHPLLQRKKPGRKPNPASAALRKAQNREAQRAFRERKERHIMHLEETSKLLREQRDRLEAENHELKNNVGALAYENWHFRGLVLTLQLVCLMNRLSIPHHDPYLDVDQLSGLLPPEILAAYSNAQTSNKPPSISASRSSGKLYVSSNAIVVTKDEIRAVPSTRITPFRRIPLSLSPMCDTPTMNDRATMFECVEEAEAQSTQPEQPRSDSEPGSPQFSARPIMLTREPVASFTLAGFQTVRLRKLLQSACTESFPSFTIEPTLLQFNVPHDPRIDLIPFTTMRDRLILYRDQFDIQECMRCLVEGASFIGGDPMTLDSWRLSPEFYEKFWFLTHDYNTEVVRERWPHLINLNALSTPDLHPSSPSDGTNSDKSSLHGAGSTVWDDMLSIKSGNEDVNMDLEGLL